MKVSGKSWEGDHQENRINQGRRKLRFRRGFQLYRIRIEKSV